MREGDTIVVTPASGHSGPAPAPARREGATPWPTRHRKLHLGHFAFMRAVVQGLDTRDSWERYLQLEGDHTDLRTVRKTIAWIRDEFAAAARRHDRHGLARLVQIDVASVVEPAPATPSLDAFVAASGMEDFSEAEQLEAYLQEYGDATQRAARRARLIARQLDALLWLENLVAEPPQAGDAVASWLHPDLAGRLEAAGLHTLRALAERINGIGKHWARAIPAIGAAKAERIVAWMRAHQDSLGIRIGTHVLFARRDIARPQLQRLVPHATAIVPLDKFIVPAALDGSQGLYRAPKPLCMLTAHNDFDAILAWLRNKHGLTPEQKAALQRKRGLDPAAPEGRLDWLQYLSHTQRAYLKEAERFLLWAIVERHKPLSSMTAEDCEAYRRFLADPAPADRWCGPRARERWSPLWRPFEGPLSPRAQRHAITILKNLYGYLMDQCYLVGNPWSGLSVPKADMKIQRGRSFTQTQWRFIERQLDQLPDTSAHHRLRFALHLLYATGMRLSGAVGVRVDDLAFQTYAYTDDDGREEIVEGWELTVMGKGGQPYQVPVPSEVIGELSSYLVARGLDPDPGHPGNRGAYLIGKATDVAERAPWSPAHIARVDPKAGLSASRLAKIVKAFFADCATAMQLVDPKSVDRFAAASTHWLRHTYGAHAVAAGMPLDVVQQNLDHASLATTTIYATAEQRRRLRAVNQFWERRPKRG